MKSHRNARLSHVAAAFVACLMSSRGAAAQSTIEVGAGWNYRQSAPTNDSYSLGVNGRLSVGARLSDHVILRLDAFAGQYNTSETTFVYPPCLFGGGPCSPERSVSSLTNGVAGLTANGLVELDRRGIFYVLGGAGGDDAFGHASAGTTYNELHVGASFGAGVALPIGRGLRAVVEAQIHGMLGPTMGTPWFVPITFGLRY